MKTFRHSGKCGDIVYSLPLIRALGGGIIYVPQNMPDNCTGLLDNVRRLLLDQPYITEVREYPSGLWYMETASGIHIDYDLDRARLQPAKGIIHIVKRYLDAFGVKMQDWKSPWLDVPASRLGYTLVNYTGRHILNAQTGQQCRTDWKKVIEGIDGQIFFAGTVPEHEWFWHNIAHVDYLHTVDMYDLASVVAGADRVYCNQSSVLALSQALGKEYWCSFKPGKTNCKLFTKNEHEI